MEVVRDRADNCIIICAIENVDPMGVHTGDSITVAPALTLTDKEYQVMRDASLAVLREIGVETGGSNVQFAVDPCHWAHDRHRDEPARIALLGAGLEGHRLSHRQGRGQAGRRLHARRDRQRHHRRRHAGLVRALDRLRRHQDPALRLREVRRRRAAPDHGDEVGRRGHGDRAHLRRVVAEGAALAGDRPRRARRGRDRGRHRRRARGRQQAARGAGAPTPDRLLVVGEALRPRHAGRGDPRDLQDRPVVHRASRRDRRPRAPRAYPRPAAGRRQHARSSRPPAFPTRGWPLLARSCDESAVPPKSTPPGSACARPTSASTPAPPSSRRRPPTCTRPMPRPSPAPWSRTRHDPRNARKVVILGGGPNRIGQGIEFDYCCCHASFALYAIRATRPSWSTATRRRSRPTTTPRTGSTSSR